MLLLINMAACLESIYDPNFMKNDVYYGYDKKGLLTNYDKDSVREYEKEDWDKDFENGFKDSKEYDDTKENVDYDDFKEYDGYSEYKDTFNNPYTTPLAYKLSPLTKNIHYNQLATYPLQQSFSRSILFATKNSLPKILSREFNDISKDLNKKLTNSIYNVRNTNIDHDKFRELIVIKKRVVSDGKHKVVNLDVSGRVVPRNGKEDKLRMILAGIVFLLAGVIFTGSIKFYQNYLKIKKVDSLGKY